MSNGFHLKGPRMTDAVKMDFLTLEQARESQRLNRAELALERANEMLDEDCGVGINLALCSRMKVSATARRRGQGFAFAKFDPASIHTAPTY